MSSSSDYKSAPCSIEDFLEPNVLEAAVLAACKQLVDGGHLQAKVSEWSADLKKLIKSADGKGGTGRRTLGKRIEAATEEIFGESISDNAIAIKYSELLQAHGAESLADYWNDESLPKLASALWSALSLPLRGDVSGIRFTA